MTKRASIRNAGVITAEPVSQCPMASHAACISSHPAASKMAPQTPLPPARRLFAAFTTHSVPASVMPIASILILPILSSPFPSDPIISEFPQIRERIRASAVRLSGIRFFPGSLSPAGKKEGGGPYLRRPAPVFRSSGRPAACLYSLPPYVVLVFISSRNLYRPSGHSRASSRPVSPRGMSLLAPW